MDVTAATNTPEMYTITASGTFTFDRNVGVRTSPFMAQSSAATYVAGESVNYDSKVKNDNHLWLSYIGASGNRVYVDYANIANNEYFGTDTNSTDPIQAGSEPTTGEGLGTLYGQEGANHADATPDGTTYTTTGNFTYTTNGAYGRETTLMDSQGIDHIVVNSTVPYTAKIKADNHYWLKYVSANDGKTYYVPYATIVDSTTGVLRYYGEDSNWGDPVYASGGSTSTGGGLPTPSDQENLGELTGAEGAAVANQTADGTVLDSQGHMGIVADVNVYETPDINSTVIDTLAGGNDIYYEAKVKSGNYYWACYSPNDDGHYVYFPYAQISPFVSYVTDENPGDPVYTTGGGTTGGRDQGGVDTGTPSLSGAQPLASLDGYKFPMKGWVKMLSGAATRTQPTFSSDFETGTTHAKGTKVNYVGKTNGTEHTRMWVKFANGHYMPIGQLSVGLNDLTKNNDSAYSETVANYVQDQNTSQPWENIWPYTKMVNGKTRGNKVYGPNNTSWEEGYNIDNLTPSEDFVPTSDEIDEMERIKSEITANRNDDDVLITYITDTHVDSYQTPGTAMGLRAIMLASYFTSHYGTDLMIHGGDLNDGVKSRELSLIDTERAVDAVKLSRRPYIILQGNHDDNSGYVRDMAGYQMDQIVTAADEWSLRSSQWLQRPSNPNNAVYGTYEIPDSNITVLVLDGFDQPEIATDTTDDGNPHFNTFRHGFTRYSKPQYDWLVNTLPQLAASGRKIMVFNHIMPRGVTGWKTLLDLSNHFENAHDLSGYSALIYDELTKYSNSIIGYVAGHTHEDDHAYSGGIQFVTTTCALPDRGTGDENRAPKGNRDQLAFDVFQISTKNGTVNRHRYGFGDDNMSPNQYLPSLGGSRLAEWSF
ncbi:hypothetical protein FC96_GL002476 [Secundilactobacillus kimchicus JCM 15530]|uniref:SH3b domain-containing protein n=2 Tax=Secundilactobacillus kimchicus TaxID=528209 RepID=A0A0R1HKX4_9LACO|nr:SH3 domain-containing protein [Secundilactobacillus kimchicus]KRK47357.1 hypothetical protein FC96_GL002476 [Secundilactobacillus kimchicus JCM 15530]